jgi:predicted anti-sigma-YlaC factor YlaD
MMNDCRNVEVREALPEVVHGTLNDVELVMVQRHVDECDDCAAELAIIRAVRKTAATPAVDLGRIVASIPPYRRKQSLIKRRYLELAAACLIGAIGISTFAVQNGGFKARVQATAASTGSENVGLALVNTSDLSDAGLAQLTQELDNLQALPPADPESVTPAALEDVPEGGTIGDSA